jgi:hypothetical protein
MHPKVALFCAFISHGNAYLRGRPGDIDALRGQSFDIGVLQFQFSDQASPNPDKLLFGDDPNLVAGDSQQWYEWLWRRGTKRLRVVHVGEVPASHGPIPVGIPPKSWRVVAEAGDRTTSWHVAWGIKDLGAPRPWRVAYIGRPEKPLSPPDENVGAAADALERAIDTASAFASKHQWLSHWVARFDDAKAALHSDEPSEIAHEQRIAIMAPAVHPLEARRLGAAATIAWVFGTVAGWWGDDIPRGAEAEFDAVSTPLYAGVVDGLRVALNAIL